MTAVTKLTSCCRGTAAQRLSRLADLAKRFAIERSNTEQIGKSLRLSAPSDPQSSSLVKKFRGFGQGSTNFQRSRIAQSGIDLETKSSTRETIFKATTFSHSNFTVQINQMMKSLLDTPVPTKALAVTSLLLIKNKNLLCDISFLFSRIVLN